MIEYPIDAYKALGFLKSPHNGVEIFVEDSTHHNMHLMVYKSILGENFRLRSVIQVGDRKRVIEACRRDQQDDERKRIYIVDGDLYLLANRRLPRLKHLYGLQSYDIENLLITETAILRVGMVFRSNDTENLLANEFNFDDWMSNVERALSLLFVVYAIAHRLEARFPTVAFPVQQVCNQAVAPLELSARSIQRRMRNVMRLLFREGLREEYYAAKPIVLNRLRSRHVVRARFISGKKYLMPLLADRMRRILKYQGTDNTLRMLLATNYIPSTEPGLAKALRQAAGLAPAA